LIPCNVNINMVFDEESWQILLSLKWFVTFFIFLKNSKMKKMKCIKFNGKIMDFFSFNFHFQNVFNKVQYWKPLINNKHPPTSFSNTNKSDFSITIYLILQSHKEIWVFENLSFCYCIAFVDEKGQYWCEFVCWKICTMHVKYEKKYH
jgi:hypothetical protein